MPGIPCTPLPGVGPTVRHPNVGKDPFEHSLPHPPVIALSYLFSTCCRGFSFLEYPGVFHLIAPGVPIIEPWLDPSKILQHDVNRPLISTAYEMKHLSGFRDRIPRKTWRAPSRTWKHTFREESPPEHQILTPELCPYFNVGCPRVFVKRSTPWVEDPPTTLSTICPPPNPVKKCHEKNGHAAPNDQVQAG